LERQPAPQQRLERGGDPALTALAQHLDVGGEQRQEQRHEPEPRGPTPSRQQEPNPARHLREPAYRHEERGRREVWWHDRPVVARHDEVEKPRQDEEQA
jgi:hypothetical protein